MPDTAPISDYRKITEALNGALDRLADKRRVMEAAQTAFQKAGEEYEAAKAAAETVHQTLKQHLSEILPTPNRRP